LDTWVLQLAPTNSSYKNKIIARNECIAMEDVGMIQRPYQTQELTLTLVFYCIWASAYTCKEVPKKENANDIK